VPDHVERLRVATVRGAAHAPRGGGVGGAPARHSLGAGMGGPPAGIARGGADHALDLVEIGLYAPETAAGEGRGLLRLAPLPGGAREETEGEQQPEPDPWPGEVFACWAPHAVLPGLAQAGGRCRYIGHFAVFGRGNSAHVHAMAA